MPGLSFSHGRDIDFPELGGPLPLELFVGIASVLKSHGSTDRPPHGASSLDPTERVAMRILDSLAPITRIGTAKFLQETSLSDLLPFSFCVRCHERREAGHVLQVLRLPAVPLRAAAERGVLILHAGLSAGK
jgi:hypothetical protein